MILQLLSFPFCFCSFCCRVPTNTRDIPSQYLNIKDPQMLCVCDVEQWADGNIVSKINLPNIYQQNDKRIYFSSSSCCSWTVCVCANVWCTYSHLPVNTFVRLLSFQVVIWSNYHIALFVPYTHNFYRSFVVFKSNFNWFSFSHSNYMWRVHRR